MRESSTHSLRRVARWLLLPGLSAVVLLFNAKAGWPPKIDLLEPFLKTNILIHFDTEPGYFYALQYTEAFTDGVPGPFWTNLYVAPKLIEPNHYVVLDTITRSQRFYRLRVYP